MMEVLKSPVSNRNSNNWSWQEPSINVKIMKQKCVGIKMFEQPRGISPKVTFSWQWEKVTWQWRKLTGAIAALCLESTSTGGDSSASPSVVSWGFHMTQGASLPTNQPQPPESHIGSGQKPINKGPVWKHSSKKWML